MVDGLWCLVQGVRHPAVPRPPDLLLLHLLARDQGARPCTPNPKLRVQGLGLRVWGLGLGVYGPWFIVSSAWLMVYGLWFIINGSEFMVYGVWFTV